MGRNSRIWAAATAGVGAGILGLSGLQGFLFYAVFAVGLLWLSLLYQMGFQAKNYLAKSSDLLQEGMFQGVTTFVLIWT